MTKVAVVFAEGFEEIEALSPVDVFRRAGFDCSMLGLESPSVTGSHGIQVAMDGVFDGNFADYDLVVLPGGMPGSTNLRDNETQTLLSGRYEGDEAKKDIHERDRAYLLRCRDSALYAAGAMGWQVISCADQGRPLPVEEVTVRLARLLDACTIPNGKEES